MNSQPVTTPDRDSLVALDALLRIRESGALNSLISKSNSLSTPSGEIGSGNRESLAPSSLQTHLAARLSSLLPINAASVLFNNSNQQNAVLAATAAQLRMAAASTWGNGLLTAGNGHSMSSGVSPSLSSTPVGTFDVSLLTIDEGIFEVKATNGDTHLGGCLQSAAKHRSRSLKIHQISRMSSLKYRIGTCHSQILNRYQIVKF